MKPYTHPTEVHSFIDILEHTLSHMLNKEETGKKNLGMHKEKTISQASVHLGGIILPPGNFKCVCERVWAHFTIHLLIAAYE